MHAASFEALRKKRGMAAFEYARDLGSYVDLVKAFYPCFRETDLVIFTCGFYVLF